MGHAGSKEDRDGGSPWGHVEVRALSRSDVLLKARRADAEDLRRGVLEAGQASMPSLAIGGT
jgi:hypothetical protein